MEITTSEIIVTIILVVIGVFGLLFGHKFKGSWHDEYLYKHRHDHYGRKEED